MNVDLRRFVPSWAAQGLKVPEDSSSHGAWQGLADAIKANPGAETEEVGLLAWNQWSAAIELYGIAAVACGQWSLAALFAHKQVVLQVPAARPQDAFFPWLLTRMVTGGVRPPLLCSTTRRVTIAAHSLIHLDPARRWLANNGQSAGRAACHSS